MRRKFKFKINYWRRKRKKTNKPKMNLKIEAEVAVVKGMVVSYNLPSQALLQISLPEEFRNVIIGTKYIDEVRGYFKNKLNTLRIKFNKILNKYGSRVGDLTIIPFDRLNAFRQEVDKLHKEYLKYDDDLEKFLKDGVIPDDIDKRAKFDMKYVKHVTEYLKQHNIEIKIPKVSHRFIVMLYPLVLDVDALREYVDKKLMRNIEKEIEATKEKIKLETKKRIEQELNNMYKQLIKIGEEEISRRKLEVAHKKLCEVIDKIENIGIHISVADRLKKLTSDMENLIEETRKYKAKTVKSSRVKNLMLDIFED